MARKKATAMFKIVLVVVVFAISNVFAAPPTASDSCIWCDYKTSGRFMNCMVQLMGDNPLFQKISPSDMNDMKIDLLAASKAIEDNGTQKNNAMNVAMAFKIGEILKKQGATQNADAETTQVIDTVKRCYEYVYKDIDSDFLKELIAAIKFILATIKNSSALKQSDGIFDTDDDDYPPKQLTVPNDGDNNFDASQGKNKGKQPPFGNGNVPQQQQIALDQNNNQQNGLLLGNIPTLDGQQQPSLFNNVPPNQPNALNIGSWYPGQGPNQWNGLPYSKQQPSGYDKVSQLQTTAFSSSKANSYSDQGTNLQNMPYNKQKPLRNGNVPQQQKTTFTGDNFNGNQNNLLNQQPSQQQTGVSRVDANSFYPVNPWNKLPFNRQTQGQKSLAQPTVSQSNAFASSTANSYAVSYQKQQQFSPDGANSLGPWVNNPQYGNQGNRNGNLGQVYPLNNQPGQNYPQNYESSNKQNIQPNYNKNSGYYPQGQRLNNQQYPGYGYPGYDYPGFQYGLGNPNSDASPYNKSPDNSLIMPDSFTTVPQKTPSFTNDGAAGSSSNTDIQKNDDVQDDSVPKQDDLSLDSTQQNIPDTKDDKTVNALKFAQTLFMKLYNSDLFKLVYNDKMTKNQILSVTPYIIYTALCNCGYSQPMALDIAKSSISFMKGLQTGCNTPTLAEAICKMLMIQCNTKGLIGSKPDLLANTLGDSMLVCLNGLVNPKDSNDKPVSLQPNGQNPLIGKTNYDNGAPNKLQSGRGKSSDIDENIAEQPIFFDDNNKNDNYNPKDGQATNLQNQPDATGADFSPPIDASKVINDQPSDNSGDDDDLTAAQKDLDLDAAYLDDDDYDDWDAFGLGYDDTDPKSTVSKQDQSNDNNKDLSNIPTLDDQSSGKQIFSFPDQQLGDNKSLKNQTDADSFIADELLKGIDSSQKPDIDLTKYDAPKFQLDGYKDSDSQKNIKIGKDADAVRRVQMLMKYALKCINGDKFDYTTYSNVIAALVKYTQKTNPDLDVQKTQLTVLIEAIFALTQLLLKSDITGINQPSLISNPAQMPLKQPSDQSYSNLQPNNFNSDYDSTQRNAYLGSVPQVGNTNQQGILALPATPVDNTGFSPQNPVLQNQDNNYASNKNLNPVGQDNYPTQNAFVPQVQPANLGPQQNIAQVPQDAGQYYNRGVDNQAWPNSLQQTDNSNANTQQFVPQSQYFAQTNPDQGNWNVLPNNVGNQPNMAFPQQGTGNPNLMPAIIPDVFRDPNNQNLPQVRDQNSWNPQAQNFQGNPNLMSNANMAAPQFNEMNNQNRQTNNLNSVLNSVPWNPAPSQMNQNAQPNPLNSMQSINQWNNGMNNPTPEQAGNQNFRDAPQQWNAPPQNGGNNPNSMQPQNQGFGPQNDMNVMRNGYQGNSGIPQYGNQGAIPQQNNPPSPQFWGK